MHRRPQNIDTRSTRHAARGAFTLVEMLVTVALVTVLMLAVTQIFSIASATLGGAQALGAAVRDAQAAQVVMARDFASVDGDSACFIIRMTQIHAFRNRSDFLGDADGVAKTIDFDRDGSNGEELDISSNTTYRNFLYNFRNHRQDFVMFFVRDRVARQTGNDGTLVSNMSSGEAAVFYHHLVLPFSDLVSFNMQDNGTTYGKTNPGADVRSETPADATRNPLNANPNNFLASQWILGRVAILLVEPIGGVINDASGNSQVYLRRNSVNSDTNPSNDDLTPLSINTPATSGGKVIQDSRYDLAAGSNDAYRSQLKNYIAQNPSNSWWSSLMCAARFEVNPFTIRPLDAERASQQAPVFVSACSQFMVEFAGDFVVQDWDPNRNGTPDEPADLADPNYGQVLGAGQDQRIDTVFNAAITSGAKLTNQIRWYGLPRDSNNDGIIRGNDGDVVPVRDVANGVQPFERHLPTTSQNAVIPLSQDYYKSTGIETSPSYTVAWGPSDTNRPKMVRVILTIDRPEAEGKLEDGQYFEYVFNVGY